MLMLVRANRRVGLRAIRGTELRSRNPRDIGPVALSDVEIEPFVEIDANAKSRLVNIEEAAQPGTEESHHGGISVREAHVSVALCTLAGIERCARGEERVIGQ